MLGLHDPDPRVREATSQAVIRGMSVEEVEDTFRGKDHQVQTIRCAIREVLTSTLSLSNDIRNFLSNVMMIFEAYTLNS